MKKSTELIKKLIALFLVVLMSINTFAALVGDNDGAAFITKAEFDSMKNDFQTQLDRYNSSIDNKIDGAIANYLAGIQVSKETIINSMYLKYGLSGADKITLKWVGKGKSVSVCDKDKQDIHLIESFYTLSFQIKSNNSITGYPYLARGITVYSNSTTTATQETKYIGNIGLLGGTFDSRGKKVYSRDCQTGENRLKSDWNTITAANSEVLNVNNTRYMVDENGYIMGIYDYEYLVQSTMTRADQRIGAYDYVLDDKVADDSGAKWTWYNTNMNGTYNRSKITTYNTSTAMGEPIAYVASLSHNDVFNTLNTANVYLDPLGSSKEYTITNYDRLTSIPQWTLDSSATWDVGYANIEPISWIIDRYNISPLNSLCKYSLGSWWRTKITWFNEQNSKDLVFNDFIKISRGNKEVKKGIVIAEIDKDYEKVKVKVKPEADGHIIIYAKTEADEQWNGNKTKYNTNPSEFACTANTEKTIEIEDVTKNSYIFMVYSPNGNDPKEISVNEIRGVSE